MRRAKFQGVIVPNEGAVTGTEATALAGFEREFKIRQIDSNTHTGKLLGNYIVKHSGSLGWTPTYFGPIVIKLTS